MTEVQAVRDLVEAGLGEPVADESFDRFARLVRRQLGVPTALVALVLEDEQVLPGALGLPEPVQTERRIPLTHSFCRFVVDTRQPLVVQDARAVPALRDNPAIDALGVVAYAGFPIFDQRGRAVGSLCAIDAVPHEWTETQLATLTDLAAACTSELRLRVERERARRMQHVALQATRRNRLLLELSEAFGDAQSVEDVVETLAIVGAGGIGARYAGLALLDPGRKSMTYTTLDHLEPRLSRSYRRVRLDDPRPSAYAARTQETVCFRSTDELVASFPATRDFVDTSVGARAFIPVLSGPRLLGVLALAWDAEKDFDKESMSVKLALATYTAHALERVRLLDERREAAKTLQAAMLTALPQVRNLELASTYSPATRTDQVGGDWYDAVVLDDDAAVLMIGDVTGHDMRAAAEMGQLRSMLRTFAWSQDEAPATLLRMLDKANSGLALQASGTAVVARMDRHVPRAPQRRSRRRGTHAAEPEPEVVRGVSYDLTWSNAGHLPPLVLRDDGRVDVLDGDPDLMLGFVPGTSRRDHSTVLHPGDTLLLYTDGLVERRGTSIGSRIERLAAALGEHHGGSTSTLPSALVRRLVGERQRDDIAVLAVRVRHGIGVPGPVGGEPALVARPVPYSSAAIAPARRWVDDVLESCEMSRDARRTAMLLTSEILTNAFEHGEPPLEVVVESDHQRVRVGVQDSSPREPTVKYPQPHEPGGRGVQFLERYASRWGVERHPVTAPHHASEPRPGPAKTVWFEMDRSRTPT
ncbi:SpoIIE family protein phosphatase [Oerskovia flava]|uniref:SpoIIE family protein phosphatase n=1 Tax=Oerskovia flava TaxID=2986422 RepID=UPI00223FF79F|nr:SpoIIE family protein phosphatase [Oerskovia sp. JB1-3-2]